jgi:hypothetical protein
MERGDNLQMQTSSAQPPTNLWIRSRQDADADLDLDALSFRCADNPALCNFWTSNTASIALLLSDIFAGIW